MDVIVAGSYKHPILHSRLQSLKDHEGSPESRRQQLIKRDKIFHGTARTKIPEHKRRLTWTQRLTTRARASARSPADPTPIVTGGRTSSAFRLFTPTPPSPT